jgi:transcriptional regulator with XRE-family HTH domain
MKEDEKPAFARNLRKARHVKKWSQDKAADLLGINRSSYSSYEEGRAFPRPQVLPTIAHVLEITNILSFLENPDFDPRHQNKEYTTQYDSPLEKMYACAGEKEKRIVDLALGIGTKEVTC